MRTDSTRISGEAEAAALDYVKQTYGDEYAPEKPNVYRGRKYAQDAHEAIRPTYIENTPDSVKQYLTNDQYKLYKLIYTRFSGQPDDACAIRTLSYEDRCERSYFQGKRLQDTVRGPSCRVRLPRRMTTTRKCCQKAEEGETLECLGVTPKQTLRSRPQDIRRLR